MTKKTTFTVTTPTGAVLKRTSENRKYTHAIIGRHSYSASLAYSSQIHKTDKTNFDYYCEVITQGANHRHASIQTPAQIAKYKEVVANYDRETYAVAQRDNRVALIEAHKAAGYYDNFIALTWCGRLDLAQKALRAHLRYDDAQIVPVTVKGS